MPEKELETLVILTTGKQDRGARATLAFAFACTSLAMGRTTALFCTMEGSLWAGKQALNGVKVEGFEALIEYVDQFLGLGGRLLVCAPCIEYYCSFDRDKMADELITEAELTGLTTVVSLIKPGTNVVSF